MGYYDIQQICLNGHRITNSYNSSPELRRKHCPNCGAETIYKCPECNTNIPGYYRAGVGSGLPRSVPTNCTNCGSAFPWAKSKREFSAHASGSLEIDHIQLVEKICSRFHLVAKQLKSRYSDRNTLVINDEYDTQDLLHSLLHIYFDDIRSEEWTPSYAGSCSRVDFLLKQEQIIIEVKKTRESLKTKDVGEQLIIDSQKYRTHPDCKILFCFVYDPDGWIANPRGLENDLNKKDNDFEIKVLIVPKGH